MYFFTLKDTLVRRSTVLSYPISTRLAFKGALTVGKGSDPFPSVSAPCRCGKYILKGRLLFWFQYKTRLALLATNKTS